MTKKESKLHSEEKYHKLSIQASLNGLSFCVYDTIGDRVVLSEKVDFPREQNPFELQRALRALLAEKKVKDYGFSEVVAIHKNNLFSLVPKALFNQDELPNYLKFNAKILANDAVDYDEIVGYEIFNVYVPFMNINNYLYEEFGEFEFMHSGTVLIQALMNVHSGSEPVCYVHVGEQQLDIVVLAQKQLLFYNSFAYHSKEDFLYYLLFTLEQLKLDPELVRTRLFGQVEEEDEIYDLCREYIRNLSLFMPVGKTGSMDEGGIDFTVLNTL